MFGDGSVAEGATASHSFSRPGPYLVIGRVFYQADYRFSGDVNWINGGVISQSAQALIEVSADETLAPPAAAGGQVLLVAKNCIGRPGAFGCGG